jgi:hypothetical protein
MREHPDSARWQAPAPQEVIRRRPVRRLAEPWLERRFTYERYAAFLDRLLAVARVVPLRDLDASTDSDRPIVALRHDVDERLDSARVLAELEAERGIAATYFMLHTASYYARLRPGHVTRNPGSIDAFLRMQALGHELGWHNDLVTLQCIWRIPPRAYLLAELDALRTAGLDVTGVAAHGGYWCNALGYHNAYFFSDIPGPQAGFPHFERVPLPDGTTVELEKGTLAEFSLVYDAYSLSHDLYLSDSRFDPHGRRWHPDDFDLGTLRPGDKAIILVHPCQWDESLPRKASRTLRRGVTRLAAPGKPVLPAPS